MRAIRAALLTASLMAAGSANAQWGNGDQPTGTIREAGGHLVTITLPYRFSNLDPSVKSLQIGCKLELRPKPGVSGSVPPAEKAAPIAVMNGAAQGTATFTWDQNEIDSRADLSRLTESAGLCWYILQMPNGGYVRSLPNQDPMAGGTGGPGTIGGTSTSDSTLIRSQEPAAQPVDRTEANFVPWVWVALKPVR